MVNYSCGYGKNKHFSLSTDIVFKVVISAFAPGLNTRKNVLNGLYVCPFIVTELLQKSKFEKLTFYK